MQPFVFTGSPSTEVIVGVPQLSVATAEPGAGKLVGLQPSVWPAGQEVNPGAWVSETVTVFIQVLVQFPVPVTNVRV